MIVQNTNLISNFVPIEKFDDWAFPLEDAEKKNLLKRLAGDSAGLMWSYPSR
jgi:hypothetical protein